MTPPAPLRVLAVVGTRPEVIKTAPVVRCLSDSPDLFSVAVCKVEQQGNVLQAALEEWELEPAHTLELAPGPRTPAAALTRMLPGLEALVAAERPDVVLVQGDTLTAFAGALAAAYAERPLAHLEAGLRSFSSAEPFPEEMHRLLIDQMAQVLYAPTPLARDNLLASGVPVERIRIVGNTGIDALRLMLGRLPCTAASRTSTAGRRSLLVTAHRRESFNGGIDRLCLALRRLASCRDDLEILYILHPNPRSHEPARAHLADRERVHLLPPVGHRDFLTLLQKADLVLTDSGGVQEEAPYLGKPVLIARDRSERPEAIHAGSAELVGTDPAAITAAVNQLLDCPELYQRRARCTHPFGDGWAAQRIRDDLMERFLKQAPHQANEEGRTRSFFSRRLVRGGEDTMTSWRREMLAWLVSGQVVDGSGAVYSWHNPANPGYAYPEIGGYLLDLLSAEATDAWPTRERIAGWLTDLIDRQGGAGRKDLLYLFDTAVILAGLLVHRQEGGRVEDRILKRAYDFLAELIAARGAVRDASGRIQTADHWSLSFGCHLLKVLRALRLYHQESGEAESLALSERLLEELCPLSEGGRFRVSSTSSLSQLHAHCYALEGLLAYLPSVRASRPDLHRLLREGADWLAAVQRSDGSFPEWHDGRNGWGKCRADVPAQAIRIWCAVEPARYRRPRERSLSFLYRLYVPGGGLRFEPHSGDVNTWATIFTIQALDWLEAPKPAQII